LAKELKKVYNINRLVLAASHGIFSKGLDVLEDYDKIYVQNNMSDYDLEAFNVASEF
jgi:trehalose-6-phosphatase